MLALFATSFLSLSSGAIAWGALGHETIGLIAQEFVSSKTKTYCQDLLDIKNDTYLGSVATWADSFRYTTAGRFSAPFHYIDAEDNPPETCSIDYQRDCGESGCSISAMKNYTARVMDTSLSALQRQQALKFIIHFVGDIHQPLHDEAIRVGGNTINVTFGGEDWNLHAVWDTAIPEKLVGGDTISDAQAWSKNLTQAMKSGVYASSKASWLSGMSLNDTVSSAMIWARGANAYVCSVVIPDGVPAVETGDLDGAYYDSTIDTIELQIATAGYRLAAWLNLIATGEIGLTVAESLKIRSQVSSFPPGYKNEYSAAKLARREFGYNCNHAH